MRQPCVAVGQVPQQPGPILLTYRYWFLFPGLQLVSFWMPLILWSFYGFFSCRKKNLGKNEWKVRYRSNKMLLLYLSTYIKFFRIWRRIHHPGWTSSSHEFIVAIISIWRNDVYLATGKVNIQHSYHILLTFKTHYIAQTVPLYSPMTQ